MIDRLALCGLAASLALAVAACDFVDGKSAAPGVAASAAARDPVIARALHDPLMSDPDLAHRSQANAVIAWGDEGALPVLGASPEASIRARDAAREALLAAGPIPAMTALAQGSGGKSLGDVAGIGDVLAAAAVPEACRAGVRAGFAWTARLDAPAAIMPQGMVDEAAGSDAGDCRVRLVRYQTAARVDDALAYHDTLAQRAGFAIKRYAAPEAMLVAKGKRGEALRVHVRALPSGMSAVDLVSYLNP